MKNKSITLLAITVLSFLTFFAYAQTPLNSAMDKIGKHDFKGALQDCNKAIEINPYLGESYQVRGVVKVGLEDYMGAIRDCNKAISLKPKNEFMAAAYTWRGVAKYQIGDHNGACIDLRKGADMGDENAYKFIVSYCN